MKKSFKWERTEIAMRDLDDFVVSDDKKIKWSRDLKAKLKVAERLNFPTKVRASLYRPFTKSNLYFDRLMNDVVYVFPSIFPTSETEKENRVICVCGIKEVKILS